MSFQAGFYFTFSITNFTRMKVFTVFLLAEIEFVEIAYLLAFHFEDISGD